MAERKVTMEYDHVCDIERDVKVEYDLEEGEIPDDNVVQDPNQGSVEFGAANTAHTSDRETVRKEVRFEETRVNQMSYYDRDAIGPMRKGTSNNSSRPILQYEDDVYEVKDEYESDEHVMDDKKNRSKAKKDKDKLDDLSVEINVMFSSTADSRNVVVDSPSTKESDKGHYRTSRSSTRSKETITSEHESKRTRTEDNKSRKRHHSSDAKNDEAPSTKRRSSYKSSSRSPNNHRVKYSTRLSESKYQPYGIKGHKTKSVTNHRIAPKKITKRTERSSGKTHHSLPHHKKRTAEYVSPILLENGKCVDSLKRESRSPMGQEPDLRSYSPVSDRSLSQSPVSNVRSTDAVNDTPDGVRGNDIIAKSVPACLNQFKLNTVTECTPAETKRTIAVRIYKSLVDRLSNCMDKYLTPHVLKAMLNKDQRNPINFQPEKLLMELLEEHVDLFVSKLSWGTRRIWPKTEVKICPIYTNNPYTKHQCNDFHICKYYLLSKCTERKCRFGHDLFIPHNKNVLEYFALNDFDESQIRRLVQTNESRNVTTLPLICKFYNNQGGCSRDGCKHLHLCKYFVKGECKFGRCKRAHTIRNGQALNVLQYCYGLYPKCEDDEAIIELLVKTLEDGNVKLKREITQCIPLVTTNQQRPNGIEEAKKTPKTYTVDGVFEHSGAEDTCRLETTKKSPDFIPLEISGEHDDSNGSDGSEPRRLIQNGQQLEEIGNKRTDDSITETMAENSRSDAPTLPIDYHEKCRAAEAIILNINGDTSVMSPTGDSEYRHKSEIISDDQSISASGEDFRCDDEVSAVDSTEKESPHSNNIDEEEEKEIMQTDQTNNKNSTPNTFVQRGLEVDDEATLLESNICPDEPVPAKSYTLNDVKVPVNPSSACILPAWTPIKPTSPKELSFDADVQCRDKCETLQTARSDCNQDDSVTILDKEPSSNNEHVAISNTQSAEPVLLVEQMDVTTSFPLDTSTRHDMLALSLTQSGTHYPNENSYPGQNVGQNGNECSTNNASGRKLDCGENSGNDSGREYNASTDIEGERECFTTNGNIIDNELIANSNDVGDRECNVMSGNVNDNENYVSCEIGSRNFKDGNENSIENEHEEMRGKGIENDSNEHSGHGNDNEWVLNNGKGHGNNYNVGNQCGIDDEGIENSGSGHENNNRTMSEEGIENDSSEGSEVTCKANDEDCRSAVFEEWSMEYKRNITTHKIRFRKNCLRWQIGTSSGVWKDVDSNDQTTVNNIASIAERYALDN